MNHYPYPIRKTYKQPPLTKAEKEAKEARLEEITAKFRRGRGLCGKV